MDRREQILNGELSFPAQFNELLKHDELSKAVDLFECIWHNYLRGNTTDTLTWYHSFEDKRYFNKCLMIFAKAGWITSHVEGNYAYLRLSEDKLLKWVDKDELIQVKFDFKFNKYRMRYSMPKSFNLSKVNDVEKSIGIERKGFYQSGFIPFWYDTKYIEKYLSMIADNVCKGLRTSIKDVTYEEICCELLAYYSQSDREYSLGNCISDSRGRAIYKCLSKVFNPIGNKEARALILLRPQQLEDTTPVYLFISELLGFKAKTIAEKEQEGRLFYLNRVLPELNQSTLYKHIWLERLYEGLDRFYKGDKSWRIPVELDAHASMVGLYGLLINDHNLIKGVNLYDTGELNDVWNIEGLTREQVKKALTPMLYGSSATPVQLWQNNDIPYNFEDVAIIEEELYNGRFKNANNFKDYLISKCKLKQKMNVKIWNEEFEINCNKFVWDVCQTEIYSIYTSSQDLMKTVTKTVHRVPDLEYFKLYVATCLLHNLDSQIANYICEQLPCLTIHDAFLVLPNDVDKVKQHVLDKVTELYHNRKQIRDNYAKSIGIADVFNDVDTGELTLSTNWLK